MISQATRESLAYVVREIDKELEKRNVRLDDLQRQVREEEGAIEELLRRRADIDRDLTASQ